ncbi:SurA N-terminal domain-containing protein [Balneola sp. MJW-20]|uniref:peptidylprolyl isomerase n=1 Tax=Gracilimonas aurantiaca TaxID=3234185 RepID=UPI00390B6291
MGLMEKMRNSTAIVLWVLIGSFGLLWVLSDVNFFDAINRGPSSLGSVNGESISFEEYENRIQYYSNAYSQQTGNSFTPELRAFYENQAWEDLVNQRLISQKMEDLGITVTDEELMDMVYGENPAPIIRQNFTREDGSIDRAAIQQLLSSTEFSQQALVLEIQLREQRKQEKLSNFITAGLQITEEDIERAFRNENSLASVSFIRFPYSEIAEGEINVTDEEIRAYYNENKENYKTAENYRLEFVSFSKMPTAQDTAQISRDVSNLRDAFASAVDDSVFLARQASVTQFRNVSVGINDVREDYREVISGLETGEVSEVFLSQGRANIIKLTDRSGDEVRFQVMAYQIEALPATIDAAAEEADDFEYYATEETSFEEEAEQRGMTTETGFATKGNTFISGLGTSQQVMNFLEGADEGDISAVIELETEFVIAQVLEVNEAGYQPLDEVRDPISVLVEIEKRKEQTLAKVNQLKNSNSSLEGIAEAEGKEIQNAESIRRGATVLTGAGREPEIIGAIFTMDEGEISNAMDGTNAAYIVRVNSRTDADLTQLDDNTRQQIRQRLEQELNQRYVNIWLTKLKEEADITDNRSALIQ